MKKKDLKEKFVLPGEKIGEKSDLKPGEGVFVQDGALYAAIPGKVKQKKGKIWIRFMEDRTSLPPRRGEIIIGRVTSVRRVHANIDLLFVIREEKVFPLERGIGGSIYIGNLGPYVEEMSDAIRRSDIILGKVSIARNVPFSISFEERDEFGCVSALCENCGNPLRKKGKRLFCKDCEEYRKRKVSTVYDFDAFRSITRVLEEKE